MKGLAHTILRITLICIVTHNFPLIIDLGRKCTEKRLCCTRIRDGPRTVHYHQ